MHVISLCKRDNTQQFVSIFICECLFLGGFVLLGKCLEELIPLRGLALFAATTSLLCLGTACLRLVAEHLGSCPLCLLLVNELHEDTLVLEHVTLALHVQRVVQMSVDLLGFTILLEQSSQDSHTSHPQYLHGHTCVRCTLPLSCAGVTTLPAGDGVFAYASARVHGNGLADDETIFDELADVLA